MRKKVHREIERGTESERERAGEYERKEESEIEF